MAAHSEEHRLVDQMTPAFRSSRTYFTRAALSFVISALATCALLVLVTSSRVLNTSLHISTLSHRPSNFGIYTAGTRQPIGPLRSTAVEVETNNPRKLGLALRLDDGTRKSHSVAQNSAFVTGFFKGIADRKSFSQLVASLYFVYEAMEMALDTTEDPAVKALDFAELRRTRSLETDMEYFYGPSWREIARPTPAAQNYVKRIQEVAATNPRLLVAHQYTRYLGDLFGGQMMSGMAMKTLNLEDGQGVNFYTFTGIESAQQFITTWYRALNELQIDEQEQEAIVDEANLVFQLNIDILEELGGNALSSMLRLFWSSLKEKLGL